MSELDLYTPVKLPTELAAVTPEIIYNLRKAALENGILSSSSQRIVLLSENPGLSVSTHSSVTNRGMIIIGEGGISPRSFIFRLVEAPGFEQAMIIWDKRIGVEDIKQFILRAPELKKRMQELLTQGQHKKLKVSEVFGPGSAYPVLPGGPSAEEIMQDFDHPEELQVRKRDGMKCIVLRSSTDYLDARERTVLAVLAEEGIDITDQGQVAKLPVGQILRIRKKIQARMKQ